MTTMPENNISPPSSRGGDLMRVLILYYVSTLIVVAAVEYAYNNITLFTHHPDHQTRTDELSCFANWDGRWYQRIATEGYTYDPQRMSSVAFYPLYPLLASGIIKLTHMRSEWALLIVSHAALIGTFYLFFRYLRARPENLLSEKGIRDSLLVLAFFPMTFFFRMTYTESLFLLLIIATLLAIRLNKSLLWIALLIGLTTATRPVGVALGPIFILHLWKESRSKKTFVFNCLCYGPICLAGLLLYMTYLNYAFGDPFAFAQTQKHWLQRHDVNTFSDKFWCLVSLQPFRDTFDPNQLGYWGNARYGAVDWLNIRFLNLIYYLGTVGLVAFGAFKRWLTRDEIILSICLLGIPYLTTGAGQSMTSAARYASVAFPVYIVIGKMLSNSQRQTVSIVLGIMMVFLFIYTTQFASWHWFI
jgi:hypothetical protein